MSTMLELRKVNFNLNAKLLSQVDDYANFHNINRTSAICLLLTRGLRFDSEYCASPEYFDALETLEDLEHQI